MSPETSEFANATNENLSTLDHFVWAPLRALWDQVVAHAPAIATGIVVLLILLIVARIVRGVVHRVLGVSRLDKALEGTRLTTVLTAFQRELTPSGAIAYLVYFAIAVMAWMTAAEIMGLSAVRDTLSAVLGYLPRLISALLVVMVGGYLAGLARRAVAALMIEIRSPYARPLEGLTEFLLLIIVFTLAINVLGADVSLITSNITIFIAGFTVTIGFLFAWSMRSPAEDIIANYYVRRLVGVGDEISVDQVSGVVKSFAPVGLMVRDKQGTEHFVPARAAMAGLKRTRQVSVEQILSRDVTP